DPAEPEYRTRSNLPGRARKRDGPTSPPFTGRPTPILIRKTEHPLKEYDHETTSNGVGWPGRPLLIRLRRLATILRQPRNKPRTSSNHHPRRDRPSRFNPHRWPAAYPPLYQPGRGYGRW